MLAAHGHPTEEIYSPQALVHDDYVDVIIIFLPTQEKEFIQNLKVQMRQDGSIDFCQLLKSLKAMSFPVEKNIISYYSYTSDMYVHCGNDPVPSNSCIPAREVVPYGEHKQVTIRIRQVQSALPLGMEAETDLNANKNDDMDGDDNGPKKRTKERRIGEVLDKVLQWRRLYTGVTDPATGQTVKLSLEESATRVGIGKKSLDDYLLQIRFGKKFGFNFNDHYNDKVGVLRSFVKKFKGKDAKETTKVKKEVVYEEEEDNEDEYTPRRRTTRRK